MKLPGSAPLAYPREKLGERSCKNKTTIPAGRANSLIAKSLNNLNRQGLLGFIDSAVYVSIRSLRRHFFRWEGGGFGIKEALFWGKYVDKWHRYNAVLNRIDQLAIDKNLVVSILEVGCGSEGLVEFYPRINEEAYIVDSLDVVLAESSPKRKYPKPFNAPTLGDARSLPFEDSSRDFVIAIDSLEHVSECNRSTYLSELIRVARKGVLLTCPMQSDDGDFLGGIYDLKYQRWHAERFGIPNSTISEHIRLGAPSLRWLSEFLPNAEIQGVFNAETWFECMRLSGLPLLGQLTGFWFLMFGAKKASDPPYYGCLVYLKK